MRVVPTQSRAENAQPRIARHRRSAALRLSVGLPKRCTQLRGAGRPPRVRHDASTEHAMDSRLHGKRATARCGVFLKAPPTGAAAHAGCVAAPSAKFPPRSGPAPVRRTRSSYGDGPRSTCVPCLLTQRRPIPLPCGLSRDLPPHEENGLQIRRYWSSACPHCLTKEQCTPSPFPAYLTLRAQLSSRGLATQAQ